MHTHDSQYRWNDSELANEKESQEYMCPWDGIMRCLCALEQADSLQGWAGVLALSSTRPGSSQPLSICLIHPHTELTGQWGPVPSFFFFSVFPFLLFNWHNRWKSYISITPCPHLIWVHLEADYLGTLLLKNGKASKHRIQIEEGFYLPPPPAYPINIISQEKQRDKLLEH